jgi:hypothetical protein
VQAAVDAIFNGDFEDAAEVAVVADEEREGMFVNAASEFEVNILTAEVFFDNKSLKPVPTYVAQHPDFKEIFRDEVPFCAVKSLNKNRECLHVSGRNIELTFWRKPDEYCKEALGMPVLFEDTLTFDGEIFQNTAWDDPRLLTHAASWIKSVVEVTLPAAKGNLYLNPGCTSAVTYAREFYLWKHDRRGTVSGYSLVESGRRCYPVQQFSSNRNRSMQYLEPILGNV